MYTDQVQVSVFFPFSLLSFPGTFALELGRLSDVPAASEKVSRRGAFVWEDSDSGLLSSSINVLQRKYISD